MQNSISSIWHRLPSDLVSRTERCIAAGCEQQSDRGDAYIFFRADDIAVPGQQFAHLLEIFSQYRVPLCLAVVPAWLTRPRWQALENVAQNTASRWCWHQHGWRHINHEAEGKKQEFGSGRLAGAIKRDLIRGRKRLESLMEDDFYKAFTPPWNRCGKNALELLKELGYKALSRKQGSLPPTPEGLPDFSVNVDLHTRKESDPVRGWDNLFMELKEALSGGFCGIMIHHKRMNDSAFDFLGLLLKELARHNHFYLVNLKDLAKILRKDSRAL